MGLRRRVKKALKAEARLWNAQAAQVERATAAQADPAEAKWPPVLAAIEAGETTWDQLPRLQKAAMPIGYIVRAKAADKRRREMPGPGGYRP